MDVSGPVASHPCLTRISPHTCCSSPGFSAAWLNTLSVLVARGRAQVSVAAAMADWPKRIRDMRYADHEDHGVAD